MKIRSLILLLCLTIICSAAQASSPNKAWKNALKPQGKAGAELVLAKNGLASYRILLPAKPSTMETKAAEDLAKWLLDMTDAKFVIVKEGTSEARNTKVISIGKTKLASSLGIKTADAKLKDEGYSINVKGNNLILTGGVRRGPINAVYALLEEDLGCRWYSRTATYIPYLPTLKFKPVIRTFVPQLEIRDPFYYDAFDGTWSLHNRTNSPSAAVPAEWGGHMSYAMFVHTFAALVPPDKYFAQHPEYFSENNGKRNPNQLCVSNPDALKITIESVKNMLKANPNARIISVSQNDGWPCCSCSECRALADKEGGLAAPLLKFVNAVSDEVGKEFPDVRISTLAYLDTFEAPKTIKPRENVAIQLCTDSHAWAQPFLKIEETEKFQKAMKDWAALGANINIWDYTVNFSHYAGPMPNWQVVTDSIRFFMNHNARGVMLQGNYQSFGTSDGSMRCWIWAKQLWDPTLDTRALMKDFVYGYYGKAADAIWEYEELCWNLWEKEHLGKLKSPAGGIRYDMNLFDQDFIDKAAECFAKATAASDDGEVLKRVEECEFQILYAQLWREYDVTQKTGKPTDPAAFKQILDKYERIGRAMNVTHLAEGAPDFEAFVNRMKQVPVK